MTASDLPAGPAGRPVPALEAAARIRAVAFDLDGTIYFGEVLADGARELIDFLHTRGTAVTFFTNNSMKTRAAVIEKLVRLGMPSTTENTYTSGSAAARYLTERGLGRVALLGAPGLAQELAAGGVDVVSDPSQADALVVGLIPDFDFSTRPALLDETPSGISIVACNLDMTYPVEGGIRKPGCGAIVRAVEAWTGREAEMVVGKPGTFMMQELCADFGLRPSEVLVVGDNYDSDIAMAKAAGCPAVLVGPSVHEHPDVPGAAGLVELRRMLEAADEQRGTP